VVPQLNQKSTKTNAAQSGKNTPLFSTLRTSSAWINNKQSLHISFFSHRRIEFLVPDGFNLCSRTKPE
jgi:hypothetical protein